jgi:hypothetical protein
VQEETLVQRERKREEEKRDEGSSSLVVSKWCLGGAATNRLYHEPPLTASDMG